MLAFGFNPATMQLWHEGAFVFRVKKRLRNRVVYLSQGFCLNGTHKNWGGGIEESKYIPYRIHGTMCISLPTNSSHENDHHSWYSWIGKYTIHPYRNGRFSSAKNRCRTFGVGVRQKWFENFGVFSGCFRGVEKILRRLVPGGGAPY